MKHRRILLLLCMTFSILQIKSSNHFFINNYSINDGIAHNMIMNMVQDSTGLIWLSTWNGIDCFDGYEFSNYKSYQSDKVKLGNNRIDGICLSSGNNIWGKTYDGIPFMFDTKKETFHKIFPDSKKKSVTKFFTLRNGIVWLTTGNNELYRIKEDYLDIPDSIRYFGNAGFPTIGNIVYTVYQDKDYDEWILSNNGVTIVGNKNIVSSSKFEFISEIGDRILLCTADGHLAEYNRSGLLSPVHLPDCITDIKKMYKVSENCLAIISLNHIAIIDLSLNSTTIGSLDKGTGNILCDWTLIDKNKDIWFFTSANKICRFNTNTAEIRIMDMPVTEKVQEFISQQYFHEDKNGGIWAMSKSGTLICHNKELDCMEAAYFENNGIAMQYSNVVRSCFSDIQNNLWLITHNGVDKATFSERMQERFGYQKFEEARGILLDSKGRTWVGLKNNVIELYNGTEYLGNIDFKGNIVNNRNAKFHSAAYCMMEDHLGNIWIGTKAKGLYILKPDGNGFRINHYINSSADPYSISNNSIYSIFSDSVNRIWIGTYGGGINLIENTENGNIRFINAGNQIKNYPLTQCSMVRCINETRQGVMLIGTTKGLISFSSDFETPDKINFFHNYCQSERSDCISNNDVMNIHQGENGSIYLSTFSAGIDICNDSMSLLSNSIRFNNINKNNGLASDMSLSAINDSDGNIWFISLTSITKYDPRNDTFDNFGQEVLKTSINISEAKPVIDKHGNLLVGTINGALRIFLNKLHKSSYSPDIIFTDVSIKNKDEKLSTSISDLSDIKLDKNERSLSITFSALDFCKFGNINYAYRMKGVDDKWIHIGKNRTASFVNLPAGNFVFEVMATNSEGVWGNKIGALPVTVTPVFMETSYASAVYVLLFMAIMAICVAIISYILNLRHSVNMEKDFVQLILKFLTDISHELRTPLTLITTPIEEVINNEKLSQKGLENMSVARRNTDRMLKLVNQILDFRKIQNNKMKLSIQQVDVTSVVNNVFESFSATATLNLINYNNQCEIESEIIYTDIDKLEKILYNLLSNAFKFTPKGHSITLHTRSESNHIMFIVEDDGNGFDPAFSESIFTRFTTGNDADPGISTGIGLSLVKELVSLLQGKIEVASSPHKGSSFTVYLPKNYDGSTPFIEFVADDISEKAELPGISSLTHEKLKSTILVIEDNTELRGFIKGLLENNYKVIEASDGREGLDLTIAEYPDIVISDVMMPNMDGIEYLDSVKNNHQTSHIPVILLTAKGSVQDQIEGLKYGADDYITKPFSSELLKTKIESILRQRELLKNHFLDIKADISGQDDNYQQSIDNILYNQNNLTEYDKEFINKIVEIVVSNIDNPDFKIDTISSSLNMSRPVFYRKTRALIGLSPIDLVKRVRIKNVIELIDSHRYNITEAAYQSGFSAPQYMSKIFKEVMGCTPSEYVSSRMNNKD